MEKKYVISVDLGGTNVRVGLISSECEIIQVYRERTIKNDKDLLANQICTLIEKLPFKEYGVSEVGISACGFIEDNLIEYMANLNIENFDLKRVIETRFPSLTVEIHNDANCTALSEATYGASKEYNSSFFITISSGIGGALVHNKHLIDLHFEIGHMFVEYNEKVYEVEQLLSGNGLVRLCKENDYDTENAGYFFKKVREQDQKAIEVLNIWKKKVAILIVNLHMLFNVDCFVLSGGVMKSSDLFFEDLKTLTNQMIKSFPLKEIVLTLAHFDQDAGLIGGASVVLAN